MSATLEIRTKPSATPVFVALLALAAVSAGAPAFEWAGAFLDWFISLRFAPWAHRPGAPWPASLACDLGAFLHTLVLLPVALLIGAAWGDGPTSSLRLRPINGRSLLAFVLVATSVNVALDSIQALAPWWPVESSGSDGGWLQAVHGVVLAPVVESLFFCGALQGPVSRTLGSRAAILVSAASFSVWHGDVPSALVLFLAGLAYAWITERSGSIFPAVVAHALNNLLAVQIGTNPVLPNALDAVVLALSALALTASVALVHRQQTADPAKLPAPRPANSL